MTEARAATTLTLALLGMCCVLAAPQPTAAEPTLPGLEAFVDGVVATFTPQSIAGVEVGVVKDGQVLLTKGYGIAGFDPERAVDPQRSLFRVG